MPSNITSHKGFRLPYSHLTLANFNGEGHGQGQGNAYFDCEIANISRMVKDMTWQTLLMPANMKSHKGFRLAYLDLTFTNSKCQGHCPAQFGSESLKMVTDRQILLLPSNMVSLVGF